MSNERTQQMTREALEQVYWLKKELKMWEKRELELFLDIAPPVKRITGMPFANTNETKSPTEDKAIRLQECAANIDRKIKELINAIEMVEEYILSLDDPFMRIILEYRCIRCMTWNEIADKIGDSCSPESIRQSYHRFVKELENEEHGIPESSNC